MKSKKVLIGLILAAFVGSAAISVAQTKANYQNNLFEIGPDNVGGRVRAIVADQNDPQHKTLYAGGVAGGLYKWAPEATNWEFIPYYTDANQSAQLTLNISFLHQAADGIIYIGTGEGMMAESANANIIVPKGKGVFQFDPATEAFTLLNGSAQMEYVNTIKSFVRDGKLYLYVGTNDGLYRWSKSEGGQWGEPQAVFTEAPVHDIEVVSGDNMVFFTSSARLFKVSIANAATATYTEITSTCADFGNPNLRIELAAAKSDKTYLYALVTNQNGGLKGVYLTTNQNQWNRLTTSTINPFSSTKDGWHASAITIDPTNHKRIVIAGANVWVGEGYSENSYYQWTQVTMSEEALNGGNFMEQVLASSSYVHSGIHQVVPVPQITFDTTGETVVADTLWAYYFATDGGIFKTTNNFTSFTTHNKGFNTVQFNSIAIAPDGSILGGTIDNACNFIQSRNAHDGGSVNNTWYDNNTTMNHLGNTLWFGNGGQVEASMFQQITPLSRRGLFFSSEGGHATGEVSMGTPLTIANVGRSYADYFDYTNTQTWSIWSDFASDLIRKNSPRACMALYETTDNQANDSITFTIDTLGDFIHNGKLTSFQDRETLGSCAKNYTFRSGDRLIVPSKAHFNYPFEWPVDCVGSTVGQKMQLTVHNPIAARFFLSALTTNDQGTLWMTMHPSDYTRVGTDGDKGMVWYNIYQTSTSNRYKAETIDCIAPSSDGDAIFICCTDTNNERSYIVRLANLNAANANDATAAELQLNFRQDNRITVRDTIYYSATDYRFNHVISAISVVNRNGNDDLLITFNSNGGEYNVAYVASANTREGRTNRVAFKSIAGGVPAYSCLIEKTTGKLFVGTAEGVYTAANINSSWTPYGDFNGVPVTAIRQQTNALPRKAYLGHSGINEEHYLFAKTKYPNAIYFGTYGRGVFMDMAFVTDTLNEISDSNDWVGIQTADKGDNRIAVYPNPASDYSTIDMAIADGGNAIIRVYDLSGKLVVNQRLGRLEEGAHTYRLDCTSLRHGMYLVNVNIGSKSATSKLIVK